ncbi:hypothetical protein [Hymenobacter lucidus]|uniref:Sigma-like protein n=1 Tax=Hymenobacter lucidus TaxID=2880930 RepID=A0ABS8AS56_9BACT|nr:hypothetical protein [Hymenobacter lucidus]MCB2408611.1 hypothetical protein [Hymenobacter lucidus]
MATTPKKTDKKANDDTQGAVGATSASTGNIQSASPTIDSEAGVTMGDGIHHLHSLAKGDEDFINGTDLQQEPKDKPKK